MSGQRRLIAGAALALVAMVVAWFMLIYRPIGSDISDVRVQVETAQAEEQSLRATLAQLESIDEDRPQQEAEVRRLIAAVPPDPELAAFILAIHDQAARADLGFVSISPTLPTAQPGLAASVIAVGIEVEGNFFNVLDFLDRVEELERLTVVDSIGMTAEEAAAEEGQAQAGAASAAPGASSSQPVEFQVGDGSQAISFRTDAASAGRQTGSVTTTTSPRAGLFLVPQQAVSRLPNRFIRVSLQARLFTTAAAVGGTEGEGATTTTTAPGGGTTTTTSAGGGG